MITDVTTINQYYQALLARDPDYTHKFYVGVRTTNVYCISTCRARKPLFKNVDFYASRAEVKAAGFRSCKICRPEQTEIDIPDFINQAIVLMNESIEGRISDDELRAKGINPTSVRRWFKRHYQLTFQAFQRQIRIKRAKAALQLGERVTDVAYNSGYDSLSGFGAAYKRITGEAPSFDKNQL